MWFWIVLHSSTLFVIEGPLSLDILVHNWKFGSSKFLQICVRSSAKTIFMVENILQLNVPSQYVQSVVEYVLGFLQTTQFLPIL